MKVPTVWLDRVKFVAGVLLVWGGVSFVKGLWEVFHPRYIMDCRLEENELCQVFDAFQPGSPWSPTPCLIETREYKLDPDNHRGDVNARATVDMDTIVLVKADYEESVIKRAGPNSVPIDHRIVFVHFVTGCRIRSARAQLSRSSGNHLTGCGANRLRGHGRRGEDTFLGSWQPAGCRV